MGGLWEPAFRDAQKASCAAEQRYKDLMQELQERELTPDDYDVLLQLEHKNTNAVHLGNYMALAFKEEQMHCEGEPDAETACMSCQQDFKADDGDEPAFDKLNLKNCEHAVHLKCLEEMFDLEKNQCF